MHNLFTRFAPGLAAVVIAAGGGMALTTVGFAQNAPPAMPPHPSMGPGGAAMRGGPDGHGGPAMHGGRMMRDVERLKTSLKLTASQSALWDRAVEQMKPPADLRESMKAHHDRMAAMLDDPNFDPRTLAAEMDSADAARRAKTNSVRDAWFAVYDSLNPVQRGQVREFLRSRMSRHHHGMEGPMDRDHRRDGEPGKAPPPAPPVSR